MSPPAELVVTLLTDAALARGEGTSGAVDVEVEHDELGIPFLGGKTLHGLVRDSWLAMGDTMAHASPTFAAAAERLLGVEGDLLDGAILGVGDARVEAGVERWVRWTVERPERGLHPPIDPAEVLEALTTIRTQTARDANGVPVDGTLRSVRLVRPGLKLHAKLEWLKQPCADDLRVLDRAVAGVRHVGLARNRGLGVVHVQCVGEGVVPDAPKAGGLGPGRRRASKVPAPTYLPYELALEAPVIASVAAGGPVATRTLPYVPGGQVRGAVAGRVDRAALERLVLDGSVRFLHAYPVAGGSRSLPTPAAWRADRDNPAGEFYDLLAYGEGAWPKAVLGDPPSFLTLGREAAEATRSSRVHHARDRVAGRAWTDSQGVERGSMFSYESLDAGQTFAGVIQVQGADEADAEAIKAELASALARPLHVGCSRRAGYGGVARVELGEPSAREHEGGHILSGDLRDGDGFRVLLTSACLARDPRTGQLDPVAAEGLLVAALGGRAKVVARVTRTTTVGGFNSYWRAPRPRCLALAAGSIFLFEATDDIAKEDLVAVEHAGLGERPEEGFGRLVLLGLGADPVDHDDEEAEDFSAAQGDDLRPRRRVSHSPVLGATGPDRPQGEPPGCAEQIEQRIVRRRLDRELDRLAAELAIDSTALPSSSLLARVRGPLRDPVRADGLQQIERWVKRKGSDTDPAVTKLKRCKLGPNQVVSLSDWLVGLADEPSTATGDAAALAQGWTVFDEKAARQVIDDAARESARRLADSVLAALARRARVEAGQRESQTRVTATAGSSQ